MDLNQFFQPDHSESNSNLRVTKRNGRLETLNLDKIHKVINWAAEGLNNVSVSQVELKSSIQFFDKMKTSDIHDIIIKAAADLISDKTPNYQFLAARLAIFSLRKRAYGEFTPPSLLEQMTKMIDMGKYDKHLIDDYSVEEINELGNFINHDRDLDYAYAGVKQLEGKYLIQNRSTKEIYETPQFVNMLVPMCLFAKYPKTIRLNYVKDFYEAVSKFKISLPTPIMSGVRTPTRQFSSCVVIESGDSLDSINATASAIVKYISQRAGIGINAGRIRALGSEIRGGEAVHTGIIPFLKYFQTAVKCCSQGGVRGGAASVFWPLWHLEAESLLVLKNNRGVEENRVRHMDYGVQLNKTMYNRLIKGQNISLFSPNDVPGLYDAFFADQNEFEKLYTKYENDPNIRKKSVKAIDLFSSLMQERASTGRIYIQNVDHCNENSPFDPSVAPVRQSNLCLVGETNVDVVIAEHEMTITLAELDELFYNNVSILVKSYNIDEGLTEYKPVTASALTKKNANLMKIEDEETGKSIICTPEHKVYTINRGYVEARNLKETDELLFD